MSGVTFERLPPERRIVAPSAASAGSCCCCCCCCLHTIGSLIGAASGKAPKPPEVIPTAVAGSDHAEPKYTVTKEYWATLLILCTIGGPLFVLAESGSSDNWRFEEWLLMYAIFLPVVQLATSVVVAIRNSFSKRPGRTERMAHLGSITARAFLGGVIGILAMLLLFGMMK